MVGTLKDFVTNGVQDLLTEKQIRHILKKYLGRDDSVLITSEIKPAAAEGICGFLGDHFRVSLHAKLDGVVNKIQLFVKSTPLKNQPKSDFISKYNYFKREMIMFKLFEEMLGCDGTNPWHTKAFIYNETLIVMPDLAVEGYTVRSHQETFDMPHALVTAAALARFHASFANYEIRKSIDRVRPYCVLQEYGHIITESTFQDSPWLRAAAKLTNNFLSVFSEKFKDIQELELLQLFIEACDRAREWNETINVIIHKDLWTNNIMFKYEKDVPINALLVDYQCVRYAPPVFDVMSFIYMNTTRSFRDQHESTILRHYFDVFTESIEDLTKQRLKVLNYDFENFLKWCEVARMFGIMQALTILPYVLMDPKAAQNTFDDPVNFEKYTNEDRTEPLVCYAREHSYYKDRQLDVSEEFVERYVLKKL